jgi:ferredoxin
MNLMINERVCIQCDKCRPGCPRNAISVHASEQTYVIDNSLCNNCQNVATVRCIAGCPVDAVEFADMPRD